MPAPAMQQTGRRQGEILLGLLRRPDVLTMVVSKLEVLSLKPDEC